MDKKVQHQTYLQASDPYSNRKTARPVIEESHAFDNIAKLAERFAIEWGKIPFDDDGEDSAGRAKGKRISPEEMIEISFNAAEKFYELAFARNHMIEIPSARHKNEILEDAE